MHLDALPALYAPFREVSYSEPADFVALCISFTCIPVVFTGLDSILVRSGAQPANAHWVSGPSDDKEPLTLPDKADVVLKVSEGLLAALKMSGAAG